MNYEKSHSRLYNTDVLFEASIDLGETDPEHSENPKGADKYQTCLRNISAVFHSSNITPILWLVKRRYGHRNKGYQNKPGCEFRLVSKACAHNYPKINTGQSKAWLTKGQRISSWRCCVYCRLCHCAGTAATGQLVRYVPYENNFPQHSPDGSFISGKDIFLPQNCSLHAWLGNRSKSSPPACPRIVAYPAKTVSKLLVKSGVLLGGRGRKEVSRISSYLNLLPSLIFSHR